MPARGLTRRDPYLNDIFDFRRNFDDLFSRMVSGPYYWDRWSSSGQPLAWIPPVECFMDQNKFHVNLALPGVNPNDVNVQAHGNELTISGERKQESTPSEDRTFQREITYGAFERVIPLPEGVQADKIEAHFRHGVLEVTAPLSEKAMPRKIEVKAIEGKSEGGKKLAA